MSLCCTQKSLKSKYISVYIWVSKTCWYVACMCINSNSVKTVEFWQLNTGGKKRIRSTTISRASKRNQSLCPPRVWLILSLLDCSPSFFTPLPQATNVHFFHSFLINESRREKLLINFKADDRTLVVAWPCLLSFDIVKCWVSLRVRCCERGCVRGKWLH